MSLAPCSSLTLTMFGKEIRHCFEVFLLEVFGMVFCWGRSRTVMCLVASAVLLIMMVICSGNVPFLLLLRFVKILNFTNSWIWISLIGLDACFGMGGCLCSLVLIWVLLGRWILLRVLVICLRVLWVLTLRHFCWIGVYLLGWESG